MTFKQRVRNLHHPPTDWLAGWLAGWLACWLAGWLSGWLTDVNFRHSSQYCKVSKKLCTKNYMFGQVSSALQYMFDGFIGLLVPTIKIVTLVCLVNSTNCMQVKHLENLCQEFAFFLSSES